MGAVRLPKILVLTIDAFVSAQHEWEAQWPEALRQRRCFFHPNAPLRVAWDLAMLPIFMQILVFVPYNMARPARTLFFAPRSVRRPLLTLQINPGSRYRRGKSTF